MRGFYHAVKGVVYSNGTIFTLSEKRILMRPQNTLWMQSYRNKRFSYLIQSSCSLSADLDGAPSHKAYESELR